MGKLFIIMALLQVLQQLMCARASNPDLPVTDMLEDEGVDLLVTLMCLAVFAYTIYWGWCEYQDKLEVEEQQRAYKSLVAKMTIAHKDAWTLEEIAQYDGAEGKPILFAVRGKVYSVWRGRNFYGKGECYQCFAGHDATRMLARELLEPEDPSQELPPLPPYERMTLADWMATFEYKYDDVGWLLDADTHIAKAEKGSSWNSTTAATPSNADHPLPGAQQDQSAPRPISRAQQARQSAGVATEGKKDNHLDLDEK